MEMVQAVFLLIHPAIKIVMAESKEPTTIKTGKWSTTLGMALIRKNSSHGNGNDARFITTMNDKL
jgi:hypothetical protein